MSAAEYGNYELSLKEITKVLKVNTFVDVPLTVTNYMNGPITISFSLSRGIKKIAGLDKDWVTVDPDEKDNVTITLFGENESSYSGFIFIKGDIIDRIPVNITVTKLGLPVDAILINIDILTPKPKVGARLKFQIDINNLIAREQFNLTVSSFVGRFSEGFNINRSFFSETDDVQLGTSVSLLKNIVLPESLEPGDYVVTVTTGFMGLTATTNRRFSVTMPFFERKLFGLIYVKWLLVIIGFIGLIIALVIIYKRHVAKKKRYAVKVEFNLLPKPGPRSVILGKIAETQKKAYFELDQLMTHAVVAGSTGGGKTVSVEILVEEALMKGIAVITFDPTAQWTGFLRKNTEKKMFDLYPKFGLKKSDARAFNGNIKQIMNAREIIDINKYMKPGELTVFSVSRLKPEEMDILVANTVKQVFAANMPESKELKLLIIFDEVHRLLPKFGGSGHGFIQIERGAREFRKWGVGLIMISQVLTDFVGDIKANITTEIQMRTRNQGDLNKISSKYGSYMLQSLLKAATGTGMLENTAYNRGNPYFIAFRPLLHNHARLTDEELDQYNKYNEIIDDIEYQIEQLEKEEVDVFDLKLELKLALDKVKSGSFNMASIYLEGLTPRLKGQWEKLGKKPKKREIKLVSEEELRKEMEKAQAARKKIETEEKGEEKKEEKAAVKELAPFRLSSGLVVINKQELIDALPTISDADFKKHVNDKKNDFADWLKETEKDVAEKLSKTKTKKGIIKILQLSLQKKKEGEAKKEK